MKITVNLDTQVVIAQPTPLRIKAGAYVPVSIAFTRNFVFVSLPNDAVIEFALKPHNQWTGGLLAYLNTFELTAGNLYTGTLNCASESLLGALGLNDSTALNDLPQLEASAEITWSIGSQKFRSGTFPVIVEAPLTDDTPVATPDPELYPAPGAIALKSEIPTLPDLTPYALRSELPVVGTAAKLDAGTPNGAATLDETGKLTGTQVPDSVAQKTDLKPFGSNRIVIANRLSLDSLPATDANGNQITEVHVGDVVHQNGIQGTFRTALVVFHDYTITDDDINYGNWIYFYDENWNSAGIYAPDFGESGTVIPADDLANALANVINSYGLNASASVTGDGQLTITSNIMGPLPGGWNFSQDFNAATYSETEGTASLSPGDFIVADLANLGNAAGYQAIGDTVDFLSGFGAPTADIGEEGNGYVDQNNGDFYHRDASGWQFVLNIKGPQGAAGMQGEAGKDGKDGINATRAILGDSAQIGTLLWTCKPLSFATGTGPIAVCFDGVNIWTANNSANNVTKLKASDGSLVGTYSVGTAPKAICFDGTNIWIANSSSNNVTKLLATTGALVGTYTAGTSPCGICFDGTNIWVSNMSSSTLTKLKASDGSLVGTYGSTSNCTTPQGICFDGTYIWVACQANILAKVKCSDGSIVGNYFSGGFPTGICFDGTYIWVSASAGNFVNKLDLNGNAVKSWISTGDGPYSLCFDGSYIYVANSGSNTVSKLDPGTATVLATYNVGSHPTGICFDGSNLWVTNQSSNTVMKL